MSRIDFYWEPEDRADELRSYAFSANIGRALAGKKGQKFLRELEAALVAMSEKRLASGVLAAAEENDDGSRTATGEVCALGAVALARAVSGGFQRHEAAQILSDEIDPYEGEWESQKQTAALLKICHPLAYEVIYQNDECGAKTPEERYEKVLDWVRKKLKEPTE